MTEVREPVPPVNLAVESPAPPAQLDGKGRCCGHKPITYKRQGIFFCPRCHREFSITTGEQQPNWAWEATSDGMFARTRCDD